MHARHIVLAVLAAAVTLTSVASAGLDAAKQRVALTATVLPVGSAMFDPLQSGTLVRDTGTFGGTWSRTPDRTLIRGGQKVYVHAAVWTFTGGKGTLVIRERTEWVDTRDPSTPPWVAVGTWKVVRGTGQYDRLTGDGRSGHAGLGRKWYARYEGFLTVP